MGIRLISSNVVANTAFKRPANENRIAVISNVNATNNHECTWNGTKNSEMAVTRMPTHRPRATPPPTYPAIITCVGTGATSSSSMFRWNLALKNDDATFAYALVITAIMIKPGTMNCM
ncbi:hypothetical protein D3C78_1599680 [compost metagenome]